MSQESLYLKPTLLLEDQFLQNHFEQEYGMNTIWIIGFFATIFCLFIQFARQEHIQYEYDDTILDIEGRLEWAQTRTSFPFGMKAQLAVSSKLLNKAKNLWKANKWHQAYRVALQSQQAMNKAQKIYSSVIKSRH